MTISTGPERVAKLAALSEKRWQVENGGFTFNNVPLPPKQIWMPLTLAQGGSGGCTYWLDLPQDNADINSRSNW
jgi:hypothetical protein